MEDNLETWAESRVWVGKEKTGREISKGNKERSGRVFMKNEKHFSVTNTKQKITWDEAGLPREHQPGPKETANNGHPAESVASREDQMGIHIVHL